jgi:predicted Zn-dependent peptidase
MNNLTIMKKLWLLIFLISAHLARSENPVVEFTEYDLSNGLHVILHEDHTAPIVVVSVLYHVGSKNEDPERTGFAHFFEHLLFEGSENMQRGEFDSLVAIAGGMNNAYTSFDQTYYFEIFPSNQLELGLYLESERMLHAKIDQIGVDTQREVVKEEKRQSYDNQPYGSRFIETFKRAYSMHPYQWMPIGNLDHINAATLEEFMDFYRTFYVPQNATLSIAGDIDIDETKKLIDQYFREIPRGPKPIPRPDMVEPPLETEVKDEIFDNIQLPMVLQAYRIPSQTDPDFYAVEMLTKILADGQSSRLYKALVDEQQIALQSGAFALPTEHPGLFIALALSNTGIGPDELNNSMDEQIRLVQNELISDREFQKIRNQVENDLISEKATMAGIAENLALNHVFYGSADEFNNKLEKYMAVDKEDIRAAARKYLTIDGRVVLYYLPKQNEEQQ